MFSSIPTTSLFCAGSTILLFLILGFVVLMRYISYRENLAYAEKGLLPPQKAGNGKGALIWGIIVGSIGLALCLGLWPIGFDQRQFPLGLGPWMLFGLIPLFFGLGLILIHFLTRKEDHADIKDSQSLAPLTRDEVK